MRRLLLLLPLLWSISCSNGPISATISDTETGIEGWLVDGVTNGPAADALVYAFDCFIDTAKPSTLLDSAFLNGAVFIVRADSAGYYFFDSIGPGSYRLLAVLAAERDTLLALTGCIEFIDSAKEYGRTDTLRAPGTISGLVTVPDYSAKGVLCYIPGTSYLAKTDSSGRYVMSGVFPGVHALSFEKEELIDTTLDDLVTVKAGETTFVSGISMRIDPKHPTFQGVIRGRVIDPDTNGIGWAMLTLDPSGQSTTSDSAGDFVFSGATPGTYVIRTRHQQHFDASSAPVVLEPADEIEDVVIRMRKNYGSICGTVVDSLTGYPLSNVLVEIPRLNRLASSDRNGLYQFFLVPADTYSVRASQLYRSNSVDTIIIQGNDTAWADTLYAVAVDRNRKIIDATVAGATENVAHLTVTVTGDSIDPDNPIGMRLQWYPALNRYGGILELPLRGNAWRAEIRVFDRMNRMIGYTDVAFDNRFKSINIPPFDAIGAYPIVTGGNDTTVSPYDTIRLCAAAVDSFSLGGREVDPSDPEVLFWEWQINGGPFIKTSGDTLILAPATPDSNYVCVVRVTDGDGNSSLDTLMVTIVEDRPRVSLQASADTVSLGDTIWLSASVTDGFGRIDSLYWDIGATGDFRRASASDTTITGPPTGGMLKCLLRAVDDDFLDDTGSVSIYVTPDPPRASARSMKTSASAGDTVVLAGSSSSDRFGSIVRYSWNIGPGDSFVDVDNGDTSIVAPFFGDSSYDRFYTLRVVDDDGQTGSDSVAIRIRNYRFTDSLALIALYQSTGGDGWKKNYMWLTDQPLEFWHSVRVDGNRVIGLDLSYNGLSGVLPPQIGMLTRLRELYLDSNSIGGTIPVELSGCANLVELDIGHNSIEGSIPPELCNLAKIKDFQLDNNQLTGAIPPEIGLMKYCERLLLEDNLLTGPIPSTIGDMPMLRGVGLKNNQLSGPIPASLGKLEKSLYYLELSGNQLEGPIPPELGNCTDLTFMFLYNNRLSGPIRSELSQCGKLRVFIADNNDLTGTIPEQFALLPRLEVLSVDSNQLSGPLPEFLSGLDSLQELYLIANNFTGPIPSSYGGFKSLIALGLAGNALEGAVPAELGNLTDLLLFLIDDNDLTGLPEEIAALPNIMPEYCNLGGNRFCALGDSAKAWADAMDPDWGETQRCSE